MYLYASNVEVTVHVFLVITQFQNINQQMNVSSLCSLRGTRKGRIRMWGIYGGIVFITEENRKCYVPEVSRALSAPSSEKRTLETS